MSASSSNSEESPEKTSSEATTGSTTRPTSEAPEPLTFWQMLGSTIAAAVGVQSSKNRQRDFSQGKASHFILMGVGFTVIFVLLMITFVSLVLPD